MGLDKMDTPRVEIAAENNYNVDINNKGLSLVVWASADVEQRYPISEGLTRGWQMTGELITRLQDATKFPDLEIINIDLNLTGTLALTEVELKEKPKREKS
ncbi:MAG: hypothetical protein ACRCZ9_08075 [Fusobacteriaceae bacterium]